MTDLDALEEIVDRSGCAPRLEGLMPCGGRPRQLSVRTLLVGVLLAASDDRPAHLSRVHRALVGLDAPDRARLGVVVPARRGPHCLTYRQVERTFSTMVRPMDPSPVPSFRGLAPLERGRRLVEARALVDAESAQRRLDAFCDDLLEASVPDCHKDSSSSVAVDWTDQPSWSRPGEKDSAIPAPDPDASWGHRTCNTPGVRGELFFGYYAQAVVMVGDEGGVPIPELVRRVCLDAPFIDPARAMAGLLSRMVASGVPLGDVLADSGYAHRSAENWASPLRALGGRLVQDLHPHDRGLKGTYGGALLFNGNLYCPATATDLLGITSLPWGPTTDMVKAHDAQAAELARYKLGRLSGDDAQGFHRVCCPAVTGKVRCPLKPDSLTAGFDRPQILSPPLGEPPRCCRQDTITVPPSINAKTKGKHDYPSKAHRESYSRRTGAERAFSTTKDPASTDTHRGWCRLFGRTKTLVMWVCATAVRNLRVLGAFERRQADDARRAAQGLPPRTRKRRRIDVLTT